MANDLLTPILSDGSEIQVLRRSVSGDPGIDDGAALEGAVLTVFSYSASGEGDDPNDRPYYLLDGPHTIGGEYWAYPEDIQVTRSAEELAAREVPSLSAVASFLASAAHFHSDIFEVHESHSGAGDGTFEIVGKTDEGLPFTATVQVLSVGRFDF